MTYGITPNIGYLHFTKNGLTVSSDGRASIAREGTGSIPVQSTRRRKYLIFCECTLMAEVTSK